MRISKITFKNYRQYSHDEIEFKKTTKNDLHIFLASNGIGKTNFLNGLNWCLYETEPHLGSKNKALPLVNLTELGNAKIGDIIKVEVIIQLKTLHKTIWITRSADYRKTEKEEPFKIDGCFQVHLQDKNNSKGMEIFSGEDASRELNRILPEAIREFFFFDGERLNNYFINENGLRIETSIKEISKIKNLISMTERLKKLSDEFQRDLGKKAPMIENCLLKLDKVKKNRDECLSDIEKCKAQIQISRTTIETCKEFLRGQENIDEIELQREILQKKLDELNEKIRIKNKSLQNHIREYSILIHLYPHFKKLLNYISEKSNSGQLPPPISREILESIILHKKCNICESTLDQLQISKINEKIKLYDLSSNSARILVEIKGSLEELIHKTLKHKDCSKDILSDLNDIEKLKSETESSINKIDSDLSKYSDQNKEKIRESHKQRQSHEVLLNNNIEKSGMLKAHLLNIENDLAIAESELEKEIKRNESFNDLSNKLTVIKKAISISEIVSEEIISEVREQIRTSTETLFGKLIWKKDTYKELILDDKYEIGLIHKDGYECIGSLSAAERALLALAFTLSLHEISGFDAPLVIDTPVSRISDRNRVNFANALVNASQYKQLILFFTPSEYSEEIQSHFENVLSSKTNLFINQDEKNIIMEVTI